MSLNILLALSYFAHLVATVIWIGGMALLVLILYPLQRRDPRFDALVEVVEARFRPFANLSLLVLLLTGVVQTSDDANYNGLLNFENAWSQAILAKHIAFVGMVGMVIFLQYGLAPALERARLLAKKGDHPDLLALQSRQRRLIQINWILGLIVLIFTAIATAL